MGCDGDSGEFEFNATAETMSETFHMETDNYTCDVNINVHLYEEMDGWNSQVAYDYFHFNGAMRAAPIPVHPDLRRRGVRGLATTTAPTTTAGERGLMCWQDEWDWEDDDGEPEYHYDVPVTTTARTGHDTGRYERHREIMPEIEPSNHSMELTVEDLVVGTNYSLQIGLSIYGTDGGYWDDMEFEFNATAETMSETFHMETDNYTCDVNINVHLYEDDYEGATESGLRQQLPRPMRGLRPPRRRPTTGWSGESGNGTSQPTTTTTAGKTVGATCAWTTATTPYHGRTTASSPRTTWSGTARVWLTPN